MTQEKVLQLTISIDQVLGGKPTEHLVSVGWTISEFPVRKRLAHDLDVVTEADDELDHFDVVARHCVETARRLDTNLVELTIDLGNLIGLSEAAREHMLDRVRQLVINQAPELTLYIGWQEDDERIRSIEERLRDLEESIRR